MLPLYFVIIARLVLGSYIQMMIKEVNMKQFKQLGWITQAILSLVLLSAMSQSNAMSVHDRYLLKHPAAKVEKSSTKDSTHHKKHQVSKIHVVKTSAHHVAQKHEQHHAVKPPTKPHSAKPVKNVTSHQSTRTHQVKKNPHRVMMPKLAPTQFDRQQARAAELALKNPSVRKQIHTKSVQTKHHHTVASTAPHRTVKHTTKKHTTTQHTAKKHLTHHTVKVVHHKHHRTQ
jgi:hypothetical protein